MTTFYQVNRDIEAGLVAKSVQKPELIL